MPTPGGLPKPGETWKRTWKLPPDWQENSIEVTIVERGTGNYWSVRVRTPDGKSQLWVDASYWFSQGEFKFVRAR